jgi:hypothetical protein
MTIMERLYLQLSLQTIELLVMHRRAVRGACGMLAGCLIDRTATQYQDAKAAGKAFADAP